MTKHHTAAWIVFGVAGAILFFAFSGAASIPPGFTTMALGVGMQAGLKAPAGGVAFVLPAGASWIGADVAPTGNVTAVKQLPVPSGSAPLLVAAVLSGMSYGFQWKDSSGATQVALLAFA